MVRIVTLAADTGYLRPYDATMRELLRIVKENPWIDLSPVSVGPFSRAMLFVGRCFRLEEPTTKYYLSSWVDLANNFLDKYNMETIAGDALIAAVIAASDVPYRLPDRYGQVAELGLDQYRGRKNNNAWRELNVTPLRPPLPPRNAIRRVEGRPLPKVTISQRDPATGHWREIGDGGPFR